MAASNWCGERRQLEHDLVITRILAASLLELILKTGTETQKALANIVLCDARAKQMDGDLDDKVKYSLRDLDDDAGELAAQMAKLSGMVKKDDEVD